MKKKINKKNLIKITTLLFFSLIILKNIPIPIISSIIISYILNTLIKNIIKKNISYKKAFVITYFSFITIFIIIVIIITPKIWNEISNFIHETPKILKITKNIILNITQEYPNYFTQKHINILTKYIISNIHNIGKQINS